MKTGTIFCSAFLFALIGLFVIAPLSFAMTSGDDSSIEEVKQKTKDLLLSLKTYTAEQRNEAVAKTKEVLENMDKHINALELQIYKNWDKMDKAARTQSRASLEALRSQRTQVAEWYGGLKNSSDAAWGHMKKGFSDAYGALHEAWEKSEKEFGSGK